MEVEFSEERIDSLKAELDAYGKEIVKLTAAIYSEHAADKYNLKDSPFQMLSLLREEVTDLLKQSQENVEYFHVHQAKILHCNALMGYLTTIGQIVDKMVLFETALSTVHLLDCCELQDELTALLHALPAGALKDSLSKEHGLLRCRLINKLRRLLDDMVRTEYGKISIHALEGYIPSEDKVLEHSISLSTIWEAVIAVDAVTDILKAVMRDIWDKLVHPLWREKKDPDITIAHSNSNSSAKVSSFTVTVGVSSEGPAQGLGVCKLPLPLLLGRLSQLLSFLSTQLLQPVLPAAGQLLMEYGLLDQLQQLLLARMPRIAADLPHFRDSLMASVQQFEDKLQVLGVHKHTLSSALDALPTTLLAIKRREVLLSARELLLKEYHNIQLVTSGDVLEDQTATLDNSLCMSKLRFDSCSVSATSMQLLTLAHSALSQTSEHTVRDIIELFIAIIPTKHPAVYTQPRMGGVFYNDFLYIAHNLVLITHKHHIGLVDFIPRLRVIAENCLSTHLHSLRGAFAVLIQNMHIHPAHSKGNNNEAAAHVLLARLTELSGEWSVLSQRIYSKLMAILLEDIVTQLLEPILSADCVSVACGNEVQRLYRDIVTRIRYVLCALSFPRTNSPAVLCLIWVHRPHPVPHGGSWSP